MGDGVQVATSVSAIEAQRLGYQAISLSEMDTSAATVIAAGSKCEISSALFSFTTACTPQATTWTAISTGNNAYITLTPAGIAGSQTLTAKWSITAPVWSDSKQGWYLSAGSTIRYIGGCIKEGATLYYHKYILPPASADGNAYISRGAVIQIGDWNMDTTTSLAVAMHIGTGQTAIQIADAARAVIRHDQDPTFGRRALDSWDAGTETISGGIYDLGNVNIILYRLGGGGFDNGNHDATSFNRGWIYVDFRLPLA